MRGITVVGALCGVTVAYADPPKVALSCTGDAIRDFKSFNLPSKTETETRIYVIDEAGKSISKIANGELVPLCDKAKPACHADFLPTGVRIAFQDGDEALQLLYYRTANTMGEQSDNATITTTFQGKCHPVDPATTIIAR